MKETVDTGSVSSIAIESAIRIGLVAILVAWCFLILQPFVIIILWGLIIAIALFPAYRWIAAKLGGRRKLAATLLCGGLLMVIVLAGLMLADSLIAGASSLREQFQAGFVIPPVPEQVANWPLIGRPLAEIWNAARTNLAAVLSEHLPELRGLALWVLQSAMSAGGALLTFVVSTIIAGFFLATSEAGSGLAQRIGKKLVAEKGDELVKDAEMTIRNVAQGILGVALIQALIAGVGFAVAGVPAAGLWTLLCVFLSVIQVGIGPVAIPVAIYMFYTADTLTASLLAVWLVFALVIDNVLKPLLLGRKAPVPMLVVFLGAIGGFLLSGIIGLFVGAVVLSLGYKLFLEWLGR
jgi:predicted PurR-regulated permease PerM